MHEQRATVRLGVKQRTGLLNQAPHLGADQLEAALQRGVLAFVFVEGADLRALVVGEQGHRRGSWQVSGLEFAWTPHVQRHAPGTHLGQEFWRGQDVLGNWHGAKMAKKKRALTGRASSD